MLELLLELTANRFWMRLGIAGVMAAIIQSNPFVNVFNLSRLPMSLTLPIDDARLVWLTCKTDPREEALGSFDDVADSSGTGHYEYQHKPRADLRSP